MGQEGALKYTGVLSPESTNVTIEAAKQAPPTAAMQEKIQFLAPQHNYA